MFIYINNHIIFAEESTFFTRFYTYLYVKSRALVPFFLKVNQHERLLALFSRIPFFLLLADLKLYIRERLPAFFIES